MKSALKTRTCKLILLWMGSGGTNPGKLGTWVSTRTKDPKMRASVYVRWAVSTDILYKEPGSSEGCTLSKKMG